MRTTYRVVWTTGDTDTCHGRRDLMELLGELGYRWDGDDVVDGDGVKRGRVEVIPAN